MALYSDIIMNQVKKMGQPLESKSETTTTQTPATEGPDFGSLMLMLMMMGAFQNPNQGGAQGAFGLSPSPVAGLEGLTGSMPQGATGQIGAGSMGGATADPAMIQQLLLALLTGGAR